MDKRGGYSGGRSASEARPPQRVPSGARRPARELTITLNSDGSLSVRGTLDRRQAPVLLRTVANHIEETDRG